MKELEAPILRACLDYLALKKIFAWRCNSGAMSGEYKGKTWFVRFASVKGLSDIIGVLRDGRFLAVEVKAPGKHATEEQQKFLDRVLKQGGVAFVAHSVDELARQLPTV